MPMRGDRTKREREGRRSSKLDWFAEDPWSDPELASLEDSQDDWEPDLWGTSDEALESWNESEDDEDSNEDDHDGWGPVRRRTKRSRED